MKLVILDTDGVINEVSGAPIGAEQEWQAIPGSLQAIAELNHGGYHVVIATHQPGLADGRLTLREMNKIHRKMHTGLAQYGGVIRGIFFCPHSPDDDCACRKPRPGLFREIEKRLGLALDGVAAIDDSLSGIQAAQAVGARPILVRTGKGREQMEDGLIPDSVPVYDDLARAASALLADG